MIVAQINYSNYMENVKNIQNGVKTYHKVAMRIYVNNA